MAPESSHPVSRRSVLRALMVGTALAGTAGCSRSESVLADAAQVLGLADTNQVDRTFYSGAMRGREIGWRVLTPTDFRAPARAVLYLNRPDTDHTDSIHRADADGPLLKSRDAGAPALAMVTVDGGDRYFHPRADGTDFAEMVAEELLPRMRDEAGLDVSVLGLAGFAAGGYGALRIAAGWSPARTITGTRIGAVAVAEPHLWRRFDSAPSGVFDDERDFRDNDLFDDRLLAGLRDVPVWIAGAEDSPYATAVSDLRSRLHAAGRTRPGEHDRRFQREVVAEQVEFLHDRLGRR